MANLNPESIVAVPKDAFQSDAKLTSEVMVNINGNNEHLFRMITGWASNDGLRPWEKRGHTHIGGETGPFINRMHAGSMQHRTAWWTVAGIASPGNAFSSDPYDILVIGRPGCNRVGIELCATIDTCSATNQIVRVYNGSTYTDFDVSNAGTPYTRLWASESGGCGKFQLTINEGRNELKLYFIDNDAGIAPTLTVYGVTVREDSTFA